MCSLHFGYSATMSSVARHGPDPRREWLVDRPLPPAPVPVSSRPVVEHKVQRASGSLATGNAQIWRSNKSLHVIPPWLRQGEGSRSLLQRAKAIARPTVPRPIIGATEAWDRSSAATGRGWLRTSIATPLAMAAPPTTNREIATTFSVCARSSESAMDFWIIPGGHPLEHDFLIPSSY